MRDHNTTIYSQNKLFLTFIDCSRFIKKGPHQTNSKQNQFCYIDHFQILGLRLGSNGCQHPTSETPKTLLNRLIKLHSQTTTGRDHSILHIPFLFTCAPTTKAAKTIHIRLIFGGCGGKLEAAPGQGCGNVCS